MSHSVPQNYRHNSLFYLAAILTGAATGVFGTLLHLGTAACLAWPGLLQARTRLHGAPLLLATGIICTLLVIIPVWLVRHFAPEAAGSGVHEIEGAMAGKRVVRWRRVLPVKFFGGLLSLSSGLVIGREGPTIHIGASLAQAISERFGLKMLESRGLLAAGAAAGLAAAFNAPIASILFVIEETRREFPYSIRTYAGVILAAAASAIVTEAISGQQPFLAVPVQLMPLTMLPAFMLLGALLGFLGVLFNRCLIGALDLSLYIGNRAGFYLIPTLAGLFVGVLLVLRPEATGGGEALIAHLVTHHLPLSVMFLVVLVRFIMTMASYATGVPGGIFAPILALATAFGLFFGLCLQAILPLPPGTASALAVAAMGGLFSATIRAPLVGVVLIAELTGSYTTMMPTLLTCLFAYLTAGWLGGRPIYTVLLERTLRLAGNAGR